MRRFITLFEVKVLHDYYKSGYSEDLIITPTEECARYLRNNKMIFRNTATGFKVSYTATDDSGTPILDLDDYTFLFAFKLKNASRFFSITDLNFGSEDYEGGNIIHFENNPPETESISPAIINYLKHDEFNYIFPYQAIDLLNDRAILEVLDYNDLSTQIEIFTDIEPDHLGYYSQKLEFKCKENTRYVFRISDTNNASQDLVVHVNSKLAREKAFGLIEINYNDDSLDSYQLQFSRKTSYWKYLIVNKSGIVDFSGEQLDISDTTVDVAAPYATNNFSNTDQPDTNIAINELDTVVFTSDELIPFYEVPKLNLQLKRVSDPPDSTETVLYTHLPNPNQPGIVNENNESEIYVFI